MYNTGLFCFPLYENGEKMKEHDLEKKYFEKFAINLLERYINIDISNFKSCERPDWQDELNNIGIEVTRDSIGTKFWADIEKVEGKKIPDKDLKKFNSKFKANGGRIITKELASIIGIEKCIFGFNDKYVYIVPSYNNGFERINEIIINKTKKLNTNYKETIKDNRLFIFSPILIKGKMPEEELNEIIKIQKEYNRNFNIIYVCILHEIYIFNMNIDKWNLIEMNKEEFNKISRKSSEEIK